MYLLHALSRIVVSRTQNGKIKDLKGKICIRQSLSAKDRADLLDAVYVNVIQNWYVKNQFMGF